MFRPALTITFNNASTVLDAGLRAIESEQREFDFSQVTAVDSAAVATMLAWTRAALLKRLDLRFINVPANLQSLASLYGVTELIPLGASVASRTDLPHH